MAVEASCVDSLHISNIVKISGKSKESTPDNHLELLFAYAHGCETRQFAAVEIQFLNNTVHLVKHIKESPIWKVEILAETVDCDDHPVRVAAVTLLDCRVGVARYSTFRQRYEAVCKTGKTRWHTTQLSF